MARVLRYELSMDALWTIKILCQYLMISRSTAYAWVKDGKLPYIRLCNHGLRFDPETIKLWATSQQRVPTEELSDGSAKNQQGMVRGHMDRHSGTTQKAGPPEVTPTNQEGRRVVRARARGERLVSLEPPTGKEV